MGIEDPTAADPRPVPQPSELEVLTDLLLGPQVGAPDLPQPGTGGIRVALDRVLIEALMRPPCVVSFSGGRDSSAVLALACDTARRHGLQLPVPAIMRFAEAPDSDEGEWQDLVLKHLGVSDYEVVSLGPELDALGPAATSFLGRHGVRWPGNAHMHRPLLELARGGTVLTGIGGDELFETRTPPRHPRAVAVGLLPPLMRAALRRARQPLDGYGWLTPLGRRRVARALAREQEGHLHRWGPALRSWYRSRGFAALTGTIGLLGADLGVVVVSPLLDPCVLAELPSAAGRHGFPSRAAALRWLVDDLLPDAVVQRQSKAVFNVPLWGAASRAFAHEWDGTGVDARWVDVREVRAEVASAEPDARILLLLQSAWLTGQRS